MDELKKATCLPEFKELEEVVLLKAVEDNAGVPQDVQVSEFPGPTKTSTNQRSYAPNGPSDHLNDQQSKPKGPQSGDNNDSGFETSPISATRDNGDFEDFPSRPSVIDLDKQNFSRRYDNRGYIRHRFILATCFIFSASIVALSAMDLKPLIERIGFIDRTGHIAFQQAPAELPANISFDRQDAGDNLRAIVESTWGGERFGYADESGKIVIKPSFSNAAPFHDGLAAAKPIGKDTKFGFIDKHGNWKIPAKYDNTVAFEHGVGAVQLNGEWSIIDRMGKILESADKSNSFTPQPAGNGMVIMRFGKYGLVTASGVALKPEYDSIANLKTNDQSYFFREQLFAEPGVDKENVLLIGKAGKYGVADANGKILLEPKYDDIKSYNRGYAVFEKSGTNKEQYDSHGRRSEGDQYGMLKPDGSIFVEAKYDNITPYDDLIALQKDGKITFIDGAGKPVKAPEVKSLVTDGYGDWIKDGLGAVVIDNKIYFMNTKGQLAFARGFEFATPFQEGFAATWDGKWWRYINTKGENVFHNKFGKLELFKNGKAKVSVPGVLFHFTHPNARINTSNAIKSNFTHENPVHDD